jgi:hypothetical protein
MIAVITSGVLFPNAKKVTLFDIQEEEEDKMRSF